jgi:hypothetical protein
MLTTQLINILPTLALLGMALTGIESAPVSLHSTFYSQRIYMHRIDPPFIPITHNYPYQPSQLPKDVILILRTHSLTALNDVITTSTSLPDKG